MSIGVAVLCLPWLRYAQPNLPRPIRVPLVFPIVYLLATIFVTVVPMYASPEETGYGCLMILTSVPVYIIFIAWRSKPKWFQQSMGNYAFFIVIYPISDRFSLVYLSFYDFCFYLSKTKTTTNNISFRRINANSTESDDGGSTKI